jgi:hypothetical protein
MNKAQALRAPPPVIICLVTLTGRPKTVPISDDVPWVLVALIGHVTEVSNCIVIVLAISLHHDILNPVAIFPPGRRSST